LGDASVWTDMVDRLRRATQGEFEIGRELGRGGMAAVFLAHELSLDRQVAIKVMSPGLFLGEGMVDRFRHEAITIAHLHHPNIVSVYSVRQAEGLHFFIMRYVQGRSLEQVIRQAGALPLPIVRSILHQVGSALTYAHRRRVVHRDIKPGNILIDADGNAIVTDFGIAKAAASPSQTMTGALVGTPAYMSPEQCRGAEVSGASDQYALGAVAYEMLTGVPPFSGSTYTVLQAQVERPPIPLRERLTDCPPEVEAAILRMLAKGPADRWPQIADAMAALGAEPLADDDPRRQELTQLTAAAAVASTPAPPARPTAPAPGAPAFAVAGIAILPPPAGLEVGDSFVLAATVRGPNGTRLPPATVTWSAEPPGVLKFDSGGGPAVAIGVGAAELTATCKGACAVLPVEVSPPRADEIVIDPPEHGVRAGDEIHLEAIARDKRGRLVGRPVSWQSADPGTATVTGGSPRHRVWPGSPPSWIPSGPASRCRCSRPASPPSTSPIGPRPPWATPSPSPGRRWTGGAAPCPTGRCCGAAAT
jgi:serine/threonine-protein kinase